MSNRLLCICMSVYRGKRITALQLTNKEIKESRTQTDSYFLKLGIVMDSGCDFFDLKTNMGIQERTFRNIFFGLCLLYFQAMPRDFVCHPNMQIDKYK
jgi:hypothetical protein